jgi:hypothetical protein
MVCVVMQGRDSTQAKYPLASHSCAACLGVLVTHIVLLAACADFLLQCSQQSNHGLQYKDPNGSSPTHSSCSPVE